MEQHGVVVSTNNDTAVVRFERAAACERCGACIHFGETEAEIVVINKIGAQAGDIVCVELNTRHFLEANVFAYILPLFLLLLGVFIGSRKSDAFGAVLGLAFAGIGFMALRLLEPRFAAMTKFQPRIVGIVQKNNASEQIKSGR